MNHHLPVRISSAAFALLAIGLSIGVDLFSPRGSIQAADVDLTVVRHHRIDSPYQGQSTSLRVLLPDNLTAGQLYRVLFILPVHEDGFFKHGDGMVELSTQNVHNEHQVICVAPAFTSKPWYADHDLDPTKRDESHLLKTVIPFIEANYPVQTGRPGRLLVGFSKSGWGALSLLLRHPDQFDKAVAWDPGIRVDMGPYREPAEREERIRTNFGSDKNFEQYRISKLLKRRGKELGNQARLFYFNRDGNPRALGGAQLHGLMVEEGIPHRYVMEPYRDHRWDSGWLPEAINFLFADQ